MLSYRTPLKGLYLSYLVPLCRVRLILSNGPVVNIGKDRGVPND